MSIYRKANVFVQDCLAGSLQETDFGYRFEYNLEYLNSEHPIAVSITLPLSSTPYESKTLFAFFDGLIPEGWLLNVIVKNWKISQNDRFGVLLVACKDCIGDVSVQEVQENE